jgi:hypothetical protein
MNNYFQYNNLNPATSYSFELEVINTVTTFVLDTKQVIITTPLQSELIIEI